MYTQKKLLTQIFGGVLLLLFTMFKFIMDPLLMKYMPPSPIKAALRSATEVASDMTGVDLGSLGLGDVSARGDIDGSGSF